MYRTNPESWLHQDSKMVPCDQCTHNPMMLWLSVAFIEYTEYCTSQYTLKISQIRPFIENEESFRKIGHGGTTWNSILRGTTVTDFRFF